MQWPSRCLVPSTDTCSKNSSRCQKKNFGKEKSKHLIVLLRRWNIVQWTTPDQIVTFLMAHSAQIFVARYFFPTHQNCCALQNTQNFLIAIVKTTATGEQTDIDEAKTSVAEASVILMQTFANKNLKILSQKWNFSQKSSIRSQYFPWQSSKSKTELGQFKCPHANPVLPGKGAWETLWWGGTVPERAGVILFFFFFWRGGGAYAPKFYTGVWWPRATRKAHIF